MTTGIKIKGGGDHILTDNVFIGTDVAIDMEDSANNFLQGNIHVSNKVIEVYGENFIEVIDIVKKSGDPEAVLALATIINSKPDNAVSAWAVLIKKFGVKIGNFSVNVLAGVIATPTYTMLKTALASQGIILP